MSSPTIAAGTVVVVLDAFGAEHQLLAASGVETEGHWFPVVWVERPLHGGGHDTVPWPVDAVRADLTL